jgi:wyosine [tRNA(Phe)-imidazoG37] synthetase (radical SAM superfamily)
MNQDLKSLNDSFSSHPRQWRDFRYVYPVISRRGHGLSIGVNLNPDASCNFDCIYCCADRSGQRAAGWIDLDVLEAELRALVTARVALFSEPEFKHVPGEYRRLNDIAFSGNGEPTLVASFPRAVQIAVNVRREYGLDETKIILITNACGLTRPAVVETLALMDRNNGEIWAKLDAGTEEYFQLIARPNCSLQEVLESILATARVRPVVLQSLFMRVRGVPPSQAEIAAYVDRVRWLLEQGAHIKLVQVYTVARRTAEAYVSPLTAEELEGIGEVVRKLPVAVEVYR